MRRRGRAARHLSPCFRCRGYPPPSTRWSAAFVMAWAPRSRSASAPLSLRMLPPFRVSALVAMPMPSASRSSDCTTYRKNRASPSRLRVE